MQSPAQISCSANCLIHLHSAAGNAWLQQRSCPYPQHVGPDGFTRFRVLTANNQPRLLSADEIYTILFRRRIAALERINGQRVQNIVALIPATNSTTYLSELSTIASAAGVHVVHYILRSVLAASAYTSLRTPGRRTILVFELGGQFLEISLLAGDRSLTIMAAVSELGCPLMNQMVSDVPWIFGMDSECDTLFLRYVRTECERAKDALCSGSATAEIKIELLGIETRTSISRESLVQMNLNHLRSGITRCLTEAGVRKEDVDEVVLVGASCNIPEVRGILLEFFQWDKFRCSIDPANLMSSTSQRFRNNFSTTFNIPVVILEGLNLGWYAL